MQAPLDLTNCDREPIHLLGAVQPFGFLLALSRAWVIIHVSVNVEKFLGYSAAELMGQSLVQFFGEDALHAIRNRLVMIENPDAVERMFRIAVRGDAKLYDLALHVTPQAIFIECEPSEPGEAFEPISVVRNMLSRVQASRTFEAFCGEAARQLRGLIGFDRVMVYRFDQDDAGEVIAESVRRTLVSFLGLHYPASDIPAQARLLYRRNWLRIIPDIGATPVPIVSDPDHGAEPVDLSMSMLRSVSPIHIEYLQNMGVGASLSVSIIVEGKLWGLFACHHMAPRHIGYERRSAAELFGQMFSMMLKSFERELNAAQQVQARDVQNELMMQLAGSDQGLAAIIEHMESFSRILNFDGLAIVLDDVIALRGETPARDQVRGLANELVRAHSGAVFATHQLSRFYPPAMDYAERAAGMLALPVSRIGRDHVLFFRKEYARTITWAGDPTKPAQVGPNGLRLTPRKSFEAWTETVRGQSRPWSPLEIALAEDLRTALVEVVLRWADVAAQDRKAASERQELLIAELNHRVRNILTLIRGLIDRSRAGAKNVDDFASLLGGRVQALARAHDQITIDNWGPAPMRALFVAEAAAYLNEQAGRVALEGPEVLLDPRAFSTVALVVHELMTNSAKYGALHGNRGKVCVTWQVQVSGDLTIDWLEEGGPPVTAPTRRGFGSAIIERSIPFDLKGDAKLEYLISGLRAHFMIPANFVVIPATAELAPNIPARMALKLSAPRLHGRGLVVEDNMIIALDAEATLLSLGVAEVDIASNIEDALEFVRSNPPDFAVLDVNLGTTSSFPIADALAAAKIPFAFATGYGQSEAFPDPHRERPVVTKPYSSDVLARVIGEVLK